MPERSRAKADVRPRHPARTIAALMLGFAFALFAAVHARAQVADARSDASVDADDARNAAILGTFGPASAGPYDNLYATAPGAEEQARRGQFRLNLLAPLNFDSNAEAIPSGGTSSFGTFPVGNLSFAAPVGDLPLRFSASANAEMKRFFDASDVDVDRLTLSGRIQYVDPTNDQAFSPYFAFTPRWSYDTTFGDQREQRQDFNLGFNKRWNFDANLRPLAAAASTSADTVWSFGVTAFAQKRLRQPQLSSDALFLIPSASWVISKDWNANFAVELLGRWYERDALGAADHDFEVLPIATLEYVVPASLFGGEETATLLGHPSIDFQGSHLTVRSTAPGVDYDQWEASATFKMGWQF